MFQTGARRRAPLLTLIFPAVAGAVSANVAVANTRAHEFVAEGDPAPGVPGGQTFWTLSRAVNNDDGHIGFTGSLQGPGTASGVNRTGLWAGKTAALNLYAREGNAAPETEPGVVFRQFSTPMLGDNDFVSFFGQLRGTGISSANDSGLWAGTAGQMNLVARAGCPAPGAPAGTTFSRTGAVTTPLGDDSELSFLSSRANALNQLLIPAFTQGAGVDPAASGGMWFYSPQAGLQNLAFSGASTPASAGLPAGVTFGSFNDSRGSAGHSLNDAGTVAFHSLLSGPGITANGNDSVIWLGTPGAGDMKIAVRSGEPASGLPGGVEFGDLYAPSLNRSNSLLFASFLRGPGIDVGNDLSYWKRESSGARKLIVREGASLPGLPAGQVFQYVFGAVIDARDDIGFQAYLTGPGVNDSNREVVGYFDASDTFHVAARSGDLAFATGDLRFASLYGDVSMNDQGWMVFTGSVTGDGVTIENNNCLWAFHPLEGTRLIAREGDEFEAVSLDGSSVIRRFRNTSLASDSGGDDGRLSMIDSQGNFIFRNELWDFRDSILQVQLPEPATGLSVLAVVPVLARRRRPRNTRGRLIRR